MSKQNLAVIFGGQSSEHEISCMSASNIIQCIDAQRYNIILVGITKEGHWVEAADLNAVQDGSWIITILITSITTYCHQMQLEKAFTV